MVDVAPVAARRRPAVRGTLAGLAVVSVLVGAGLAVGVWSTTTYDANGDQCASAFHFHPGSSYLIHGGELSDAERLQISNQCDADGSGPWRAGGVALAGGLLASAACVVGLTATRSKGAGSLR